MALSGMLIGLAGKKPAPVARIMKYGICWLFMSDFGLFCLSSEKKRPENPGLASVPVKKPEGLDLLVE